MSLDIWERNNDPKDLLLCRGNTVLNGGWGIRKSKGRPGFYHACTSNGVVVTRDIPMRKVVTLSRFQEVQGGVDEILRRFERNYKRLKTGDWVLRKGVKFAERVYECPCCQGYGKISTAQMKDIKERQKPWRFAETD